MVFLSPKSLILPVLLILVAAGPGVASGASPSVPSAEVQAALTELRVWLGDDENGERWNRFLMTDELEAILKADTARPDPSTLQLILDAYKADWDGLDKRRFVAVRKSLENWKRELDASAAPETLRPLDTVSLEGLAAAAAAAQQEFEPITPERVEQARERLDAAITDVENLFARTSDEQVATWKQQVEWTALEEELANPEGPNLARLNTVRAALRGDVEGLERPEFLELRTALSDYMNAVTFGRDTSRTQAFFNQQLNALAQQLQTFEQEPSEANARPIGPILSFLERARQTPGLIRRLKQEFLKPNLYVRASDSLVAAGISERVNETNRISEVILDTSVRGTANLVGNVSGSVVPNSERASIGVYLNGTAYSNNVGYNGPVTIYTRGRTAVSAGTQLHIDADGIYATPAWARASTATTINSICAKCALVRRVAWKRASASKGQAERIASGRARGRIAYRVDQRTSGLVADANRDFEQKFRAPLLRRAAFPEQLQFSTTNAALAIKATQVVENYLAAFSDPPEPTGSYPLTIQVHESFAGNLSTGLLGGYKLTDQKLVELYEKAEREVPADLRDPDEPWGITFAREQPVNVEFRDDEIKIEVRCSFVHQGEDYPAIGVSADEIRISATYEMRLQDGGIKLIRTSGDTVKVDFVDKNGQPAQVGTAGIAAKTLLEKKFNAMLKPELPEGPPQGLELPGRWARAGKLFAREAQSSAGWLVVGWQNEATGTGSDEPTPQDDAPPADEAPAPDVIQTVANES